MTLSWLQTLLDALAVYRLTRLIVADTITAGLRNLASGRKAGNARDPAGEEIMMVARPRLAELVSCPWCVSPYLAALVVAAQALIPAIWIYASSTLAFSAVAGLISERN